MFGADPAVQNAGDFAGVMTTTWHHCRQQDPRQTPRGSILRRVYTPDDEVAQGFSVRLSGMILKGEYGGWCECGSVKV